MSTTTSKANAGKYRGVVFALMPVPKMSGHAIVTHLLLSASPNGNCRNRVESRTAATNPYGAQANQVGIREGSLASSRSTFKEPIQSCGQLDSAGKFQVSLGSRKPRRAANVTIARPIIDPSSEGNSGPSQMAVAT